MSKNRSITITKEDIEAFHLLHDVFCTADSGSDEPEWMPEEDRKKISNLYQKFKVK